MVRLSYSQKLCSVQIWVTQYLKIILSICCNLPAASKRLNEPHRTTGKRLRDSQGRFTVTDNITAPHLGAFALIVPDL